MKKMLRQVILMLLVSLPAISSDYVVIANKEMKDISKSQIKAIFLKKLTLMDDINIVPINMGATNFVRIKFEKHILKMSFSRLKAYWTKQHYLGHRPPITMKSQESVKAFVKKVDGAIGYIEANNVDDSLKILYKWSE